MSLGGAAQATPATPPRLITAPIAPVAQPLLLQEDAEERPDPRLHVGHEEVERLERRAHSRIFSVIAQPAALVRAVSGAGLKGFRPTDYGRIRQVTLALAPGSHQRV
jgi:hypothetical protein